jgi:hypothetical protein
MSESRAAAVRRRDGWATRGVRLFVRKPHVWPTPRLGTSGVNRCFLWHRYAVISPAYAKVAVTTLIKDVLEFFCFAAKTEGSAAKWWSLNRVLK